MRLLFSVSDFYESHPTFLKIQEAINTDQKVEDKNKKENPTISMMDNIDDDEEEEEEENGDEIDLEDESTMKVKFLKLVQCMLFNPLKVQTNSLFMHRMEELVIYLLSQEFSSLQQQPSLNPGDERKIELSSQIELEMIIQLINFLIYSHHNLNDIFPILISLLRKFLLAMVVEKRRTSSIPNILSIFILFHNTLQSRDNSSLQVFILLLLLYVILENISLF